MAGDSEVELKLELGAGAAAALLRHPYVLRYAIGTPTTQRLRSVYFDTVDRTLRREGMSLRIREVGDEGRVQTLKAGERALAGLYVRREDEVEVESDAPDPNAIADPLLRETLQRVLGGRTLRGLFETDMQRTQLRMRDGDDAWSLDLDVGEVRCSGSPIVDPLCEFELELSKGEPRRLYDAALALLEDLDLTVGLLSKAARGYGLADGARAAPPVREELERLRASLDAIAPESRSALEADLDALDTELTTVRELADLERLRRSKRFARTALELGRTVAAG